MMRPVSQETTKRKPSAASRIRCFSSLSVRKEGLYVPDTADDDEHIGENENQVGTVVWRRVRDPSQGLYVRHSHPENKHKVSSLVR